MADLAVDAHDRRPDRARHSSACPRGRAEGAEIEFEVLSKGPPRLVQPNSRPIQLGLDAFDRAVGARPLSSGAGVRFRPSPPSRIEISTIVTGFGLSDSNIHSPNERMLPEYPTLGFEAAKELYRSFAALG